MNVELIIQITVGVGLVLIFTFTVRAKAHLVRRYAKAQGMDRRQTAVVNKLLTAALFVGLVAAEAVTWGVYAEGVYVFITSLFALVAIGFFAVWSVLSNITSSLLIFFLFPFKIGDRIEVVGDDIKGVISDLTLFHMIIDSGDGGLVTIPNNVVIQRSIRILPREASEAGELP